MTDDWQEEELTSHYFPGAKREERKEKKIASRTDRSKFKKTDRAKTNQTQAKEGLTKGRILSIISEEMNVDVEGQTIVCTLRGVLKKEKTKEKNLVTAGDFVDVDLLPDGTGVIHAVHPRKSYLSRAETLNQRRKQLIASNIDFVLITSSVVAPSLKPSLIDRYIIATKQGNMEPIILINKVDLLKQDNLIAKEEKELLQRTMDAYEKLECPVIMLSVETGEGIDELKELMQGQSSVFSGQSGVGKSSLINAVTGLDLPVGETTDRTRKGSHTTTNASLIPLEFGGFCIDTPGIKSFGMWELDIPKVQLYYPDFFPYAEYCRFPNCCHTHEPDCKVKEAVDKGEISKLRYESYVGLIQTLSEEHKRR